MTDFPSLDDELRPRAKLKRHLDEPTVDAEIDANSQRLGERWGLTTPAPAPAPPVTPTAPVVSIRGYIPDYLDDELTQVSAARRVTKTFLIMEALAKAGYRVDDPDLIQDRRKKPRQ